MYSSAGSPALGGGLRGRQRGPERLLPLVQVPCVHLADALLHQRLDPPRDGEIAPACDAAEQRGRLRVAVQVVQGLGLVEGGVQRVTRAERVGDLREVVAGRVPVLHPLACEAGVEPRPDPMGTLGERRHQPLEAGRRARGVARARRRSTRGEQLLVVHLQQREVGPDLLGGMESVSLRGPVDPVVAHRVSNRSGSRARARWIAAARKGKNGETEAASLQDRSLAQQVGPCPPECAQVVDLVREAGYRDQRDRRRALAEETDARAVPVGQRPGLEQRPDQLAPQRLGEPLQLGVRRGRRAPPAPGSPPRHRAAAPGRRAPRGTGAPPRAARATPPPRGGSRSRATPAARAPPAPARGTARSSRSPLRGTPPAPPGCPRR